MFFHRQTAPASQEQIEKFLAGEYRPGANTTRAEQVRDAYSAIGGELLGQREKCFDTSLGPVSVAFIENSPRAPYLQISLDPGNAASSRFLVGFLDGAFILTGRRTKHRVDAVIKSLTEEARRCNELHWRDRFEAVALLMSTLTIDEAGLRMDEGRARESFAQDHQLVIAVLRRLSLGALLLEDLEPERRRLFLTDLTSILQSREQTLRLVNSLCGDMPEEWGQDVSAPWKPDTREDLEEGDLPDGSERTAPPKLESLFSAYQLDKIGRLGLGGLETEELNGLLKHEWALLFIAARLQKSTGQNSS